MTMANNVTVKKGGLEVQISVGNKKMTNGFMIFNLPCRITCPGKTGMCSKYCYAAKREFNPRFGKAVHGRRIKNLAASKSNEFVDLMVTAIEKTHTKTGAVLFRIHESGDFYDQAYLNKWLEIAKHFPNIQFLAFTKSFNLDFSVPENMKIIWSIWPDTDMAKVPTYGFKAYAGNCGHTSCYECPGQCDTCQICWNPIDDVHFAIH